MPIENEIKFVLEPNAALIDQRLATQSAKWDLQQGYLPGRGRIRRSTLGNGNFDVFNYKITDLDGKLIEIETIISESDFLRLWPLTTERLIKSRYTVRLDDHQWDVDLFQHDDAVYFAMAECEMIETMERPPKLLDEIADLIIFEVPRFDRRFTSRALSDIEEASGLLAELRNKLA